MPTRLEMTPKTLITLLCLGTATVAGSQTTDELDMMISRLEAASGTENALPIADSAYSLATALGDTATSDYVLMNRVSCLQQLSLYDSTIIWADRVEQILRQHGNYDYIYPTIYIRILSYIEVGKYQLAMQQAKKLLAEANERGSLVAKIYAMECQGLVNSEQGRDDEAFATYTNCLNEIENSGNVEELSSKWPPSAYRPRSTSKTRTRHWPCSTSTAESSRSSARRTRTPPTCSSKTTG